MRTFDHLRPEKLTEDAEQEEVTIYKQAFKVWFTEVCGTNGIDTDLNFLKVSVLSTVDKSWQTILNSNPDINGAKLEDVFKIIDRTMLVRKPIYLRRAQLTSIRQNEGESEGAYLRRIMNVGGSADMKTCTPETLFLLIFCQTLRKSEINQTVTNLIYEELRQNDNPTSLNTILDKIDAITSNFNCARKTTHIQIKRR